MTDRQLSDVYYALKNEGGNTPLEEFFGSLCEAADLTGSQLYPRLLALGLAHPNDAELLDLTYGE